MEISPLTARGFAPAAPIDANTPPGGDPRAGRAVKPADSEPRADPSGHDWHELHLLAERAGLQVRFETLPHSNVTLVKMVEPDTGRVVREFPPESLATTLAGIRALAASRLDRKA